MSGSRSSKGFRVEPVKDGTSGRHVLAYSVEGAEHAAVSMLWPVTSQMLQARVLSDIKTPLTADMLRPKLVESDRARAADSVRIYYRGHLIAEYTVDDVPGLGAQPEQFLARKIEAALEPASKLPPKPNGIRKQEAYDLIKNVLYECNLDGDDLDHRTAALFDLLRPYLK